MYRSNNLSIASNAHVQRWNNSKFLKSSSFASLKEIMANLAAQAAAKKPGGIGASVPPAFNTLVMPKNPGQPNRPQAGRLDLESIWRDKLKKQLLAQKFEVNAPVRIRFSSSIPAGAGSTGRATMQKLAEQATAKAKNVSLSPSSSNPAMKLSDIKMPSHDVAGGIAVPTDPSINTTLLSVQPKRRGRPPKKLGGITTTSPELASDVTVSNDPPTIAILPVQPKRRGRPPKKLDGITTSSPGVANDIAVSNDPSTDITLLSVQLRRKRGRPAAKKLDVITISSPEVPSAELSSNTTLLSVQPKKRGRPPKKLDVVTNSLPGVTVDSAVPTNPSAVVAPLPTRLSLNPLMTLDGVNFENIWKGWHRYGQQPPQKLEMDTLVSTKFEMATVAGASIRETVQRLADEQKRDLARAERNNVRAESIRGEKRNKQHVLHSEVDAPVPSRFDSSNPAAAAGASNSKTTLDQAETYSIRTFMANRAKERGEKGELSLWERLERVVASKPLPEFNISSPATSNGTSMA